MIIIKLFFSGMKRDFTFTNLSNSNGFVSWMTELHLGQVFSSLSCKYKTMHFLQTEKSNHCIDIFRFMLVNVI
jgi:hypothetical protein